MQGIGGKGLEEMLSAQLILWCCSGRRLLSESRFLSGQVGDQKRRSLPGSSQGQSCNLALLPLSGEFQSPGDFCSYTASLCHHWLPRSPESTPWEGTCHLCLHRIERLILWVFFCILGAKTKSHPTSLYLFTLSVGSVSFQVQLIACPISIPTGRDGGNGNKNPFP